METVPSTRGTDGDAGASRGPRRGTPPPVSLPVVGGERDGLEDHRNTLPTPTGSYPEDPISTETPTTVPTEKVRHFSDPVPGGPVEGGRGRGTEEEEG